MRTNTIISGEGILIILILVVPVTLILNLGIRITIVTFLQKEIREAYVRTQANLHYLPLGW